MATKKQTKTGPRAHEVDGKFVYESSAGTLTFPYYEDVPMGIVEDALAGPANQVEGVILAGIMDEKTNATRRKMTIREFNEMMRAWSDESDLTLGE